MEYVGFGGEGDGRRGERGRRIEGRKGEKRGGEKGVCLYFFCGKSISLLRFFFFFSVSLACHPMGLKLFYCYHFYFRF